MLGLKLIHISKRGYWRKTTESGYNIVYQLQRLSSLPYFHIFTTIVVLSCEYAWILYMALPIEPLVNVMNIILHINTVSMYWHASLVLLKENRAHANNVAWLVWWKKLSDTRDTALKFETAWDGREWSGTYLTQNISIRGERLCR